MCNTLEKLLFDSFGTLSEEVRFLIPNTKHALDLHRALFSCLSPEAQKMLVKELEDNPRLSEQILEGILLSIDRNGYQSAFGPGGIMLPIRPDAAMTAKAIAADADSLMKRFPMFVGTDRPAFRKDDNEFLPSIETCVCTALSFMDSDTGWAVSDCSEDLFSRAYALLAREKGFSDIADAERALDAAAYDADFTDGLCSGEG